MRELPPLVLKLTNLIEKIHNQSDTQPAFIEEFIGKLTYLAFRPNSTNTAYVEQGIKFIEAMVEFAMRLELLEGAQKKRYDLTVVCKRGRATYISIGKKMEDPTKSVELFEVKQQDVDDLFILTGQAALAKDMVTLPAPVKVERKNGIRKKRNKGKKKSHQQVSEATPSAKATDQKNDPEKQLGELTTQIRSLSDDANLINFKNFLLAFSENKVINLDLKIQPLEESITLFVRLLELFTLYRKLPQQLEKNESLIECIISVMTYTAKIPHELQVNLKNSSEDSSKKFVATFEKALQEWSNLLGKAEEGLTVLANQTISNTEEEITSLIQQAELTKSDVNNQKEKFGGLAQQAEKDRAALEDEKQTTIAVKTEAENLLTTLRDIQIEAQQEGDAKAISTELAKKIEVIERQLVSIESLIKENDALQTKSAEGIEKAVGQEEKVTLPNADATSPCSARLATAFEIKEKAEKYVNKLKGSLVSMNAVEGEITEIKNKIKNIEKEFKKDETVSEEIEKLQCAVTNIKLEAERLQREAKEKARQEEIEKLTGAIRVINSSFEEYKNLANEIKQSIGSSYIMPQHIGAVEDYFCGNTKIHYHLANARYKAVEKHHTDVQAVMGQIGALTVSVDNIVSRIENLDAHSESYVASLKNEIDRLNQFNESAGQFREKAEKALEKYKKELREFNQEFQAYQELKTEDAALKQKETDKINEEKFLKKLEDGAVSISEKYEKVLKIAANQAVQLYRENRQDIEEQFSVMFEPLFIYRSVEFASKKNDLTLEEALENKGKKDSSKEAENEDTKDSSDPKTKECPPDVIRANMIFLMSFIKQPKKSTVQQNNEKIQTAPLSTLPEPIVKAILAIENLANSTRFKLGFFTFTWQRREKFAWSQNTTARNYSAAIRLLFENSGSEDANKLLMQFEQLLNMRKAELGGNEVLASRDAIWQNLGVIVENYRAQVEYQRPAGPCTR